MSKNLNEISFDELSREDLEEIAEEIVTAVYLVKTRVKHKVKIDRYIKRLPDTRIIFSDCSKGEYQIIKQRS